jgi:hypothetical protein
VFDIKVSADFSPYAIGYTQNSNYVIHQLVDRVPHSSNYQPSIVVDAFKPYLFLFLTPGGRKFA